MSTFFKAIRHTVKYWYLPAIVGVLFVLLGLYMFSVPEATYFTLLTFFSLSFLFSGLLEAFFSIQNKEQLEGWGWYLSGGIFSFLVGLLLLFKPMLAAVTLSVFVGLSLLFRSIQHLGFAFELKQYGAKWGGLAIFSFISIVVSLLLLFNPVAIGMSLVVLTALTFILSGISAVVLAFELKRIKKAAANVDDDFKDRLENLKKEYFEKVNKND